MNWGLNQSFLFTVDVTLRHIYTCPLKPVLIMKGLILAAGEGNRLGDINNGLPKLFLDIKNKKIYDYQIDAIADYCDEVIVVLGYGFDSGSERSPEEYLETDVDITINSIVLDNWNKVENAVSCMHGLTKLKDMDDVLILCGDILLTPNVAKIMVESFESELRPSQYSAVGAVKGLQDKMTAVRWDSAGTITHYGKIQGHREAGCFILHRDHISEAIDILSQHPKEWFPIIFPRIPTKRILIPREQQHEINTPQHYSEVDLRFHP